MLQNSRLTSYKTFYWKSQRGFPFFTNPQKQQKFHGKSRPMLFVSRNDRPWHHFVFEKNLCTFKPVVIPDMKVWNAPKKPRRFNMNMAKLSCLKQRLLVTNMSNFLLVILLMAQFLRQLRLLNIPANTNKKTWTCSFKRSSKYSKWKVDGTVPTYWFIRTLY